MPSWQKFEHLFNQGPTQPWPTLTESPANPGFDNLIYDWTLATNYPNALSADGTGRVIRLPGTLDPVGGVAVFSASNIGSTAWPTYYSYLVKPEPTTAAESQYRVAIRFKCVTPVGDAYNVITQYGICFRHKLTGSATGSGVQRRELQSEFQWASSGGSPGANLQIASKWDNASNLGGAFGATALVSSGAALDTYLWMTGEITTSGGVTTLVTKLYRDTGTGANGFDPNDYESATPIATVASQSSSHADANSTGYCGFYCAGSQRTPPGWEVTDFVTFLPVTDTTGPVIMGGSVDGDGKTLRARFGETSLPLASSGGALTGFTFEARSGYSGAWSTVTTGTPVVDSADTSQIKAIATTAIPPGWDVRCTYNSGTGNLVDDAGNAATTGTGYFANHSKVDPALNVAWDREMLLGTNGWLRVSGRAPAAGYEGQTVRFKTLPYGCSSAGIKIYWEGFSEAATGTGLTVSILAAGVRAVQPDGTVTTHTLTFNGSGTGATTIAYNAMDWAPLVAAFPPLTRLYITTWYKEAAGGSLPYQWQEIIDRSYAGSDEFCAAHEVGLIGTLTNKVLLGGTSGGPTHTTASPTLAGPDGRAYTYGPAFVLGLPHPTYAETPKPILGFGNSMVIDSVIKPLLAYACGDPKNPSTLQAYCTTGVGGSIAASFLTSVATNAPTALLIGTTSANTKLSRAIEIYGHNEVRTPQSGVTHPTGHIAYLWNMRTSCAAVFANLGITYLTSTITPIGISWLTNWASELREMVPKVIATHNAELLSRWQTIPGVDGVVDFASVDGAPRSSYRSLESPADPRAGFSEWFLPTNQTAGDSIHGTALNTAQRGSMLMAKFREVDLAAESGGGGGGTTSRVSGQARRGRG